jgi:hypothetical protein
MTPRSAGRRRDRELLKAIETQNRLHDALKLLFELLETYSPPGMKKNHDQAESALKVHANGMSGSANGPEGQPQGEPLAKNRG